MAETDAALTEAAGTAAAATAPRNPAAQAAIAAALTASVLPGEAEGMGEAQIVEAARFLAAAAATRTPGQPALMVEGFAAPDGTRLMRLAVVNDDMPFLVDSTSLVVAAEGLAVARILHPVVAVRRGPDGALEQIAPRGASGERHESLIYMEMDRADARGRRRLVDALGAALADVRAAVRDWRAMQAAMLADADRVADGEGAALLRWFVDGQMTQLGHERRGRDGAAQGQLGVCAASDQPVLSNEAVAAAFAWFDRGGRAPLLVKSNRLSAVHRRVMMDVVIVPVMGDAGIAALSLHAGLWTSAALSAPPAKVPVLRTQLTTLLDRLGFDPSGHDGKALAHALTALPHDILIACDTATLEAVALTSMSITDRPRPKLTAIPSALRRHLHVFVWLPRDDVSTGRRVAIEAMLVEAAKARLIGWTIGMDEGGTALLRYTLDLRGGGEVPDTAALDAALKQMVRGWVPAVAAELAQMGDAGRAAVLAGRFADAFTANYRNLYGPDEAARDIMELRHLDDGQPQRVRVTGAAGGGGTAGLGLKVYNLGGPLSLSQVVPVLENFGFAVLEEFPSQLVPADGPPLFIHDFRLGLPAGVDRADVAARAAVLEGAVAATIGGAAENDAFNSLIVAPGLDPQAAVWLRAWFRYLRQAGMATGIAAVVAALRGAPSITTALIALFRQRHDPAEQDAGRGGAAAAELIAGIDRDLDAVTGLDDDRILRLMRAVVSATLRTNAFAPAAAEALAFKLDSAAIPILPRPLPWREIFVYSPRVEGIHLRAGPVARGGLRWSDRRDDFRTEILGLMKAQRVKNAVIVPTGAKGGFYPKALPDPAAGRDAWLAEGTECYRIFIRTLLSITDNLVGGKLAPPADVVVHDGEDPYFVVAADKGTATFSDIANGLAMARNFWLGDAFASGGSNGYDHKAMGITARGAWLSVQRHFAEQGVDVQTDSISVAGCGDMSGDVFGNGMLLSPAIRLVAAFDHRHIFLDPSPDPAASHTERARLFALARSSWADYDPALISPGGGVFARSQKLIPLSEAVRAALGITASELPPTALIAAILRAPVDLIWFGGIGTYVKAAAQNNADVGDPANDAVRVDAEQLRARAIGEGANLGITQAARIAFALNGGRVNADFIDNSAGVDCSDNEVNIKIALNQLMADGALALDDRNALLTAMTDAVAAHVLEDNRLQALALSVAERDGAAAVPALLRVIDRFEAAGRLDRAVEGLAANDVLLRRVQDGQGLMRPELAVLMATAKLAFQEAIEASALPGDPLLAGELAAAFPAPMRARFADAIAAHPLAREIIATRLANRLVNRLGVRLPLELAEEQGCGLADLAAMFVAAEGLFAAEPLWQALDTAALAEPVRLDLFATSAAALTSHMADLLRLHPPGTQPGAVIAALAPGVTALTQATDAVLTEAMAQQWQAASERMQGAGVPGDLAAPVLMLQKTDGIVGLAQLATRHGAAPDALARAFVLLGAGLGIDWAQSLAARMSPSDPWERMLVNSLARDFQQMRLDFLARLDGGDPVTAAQDWLATNAGAVGQYRAMIDRSRTTASPNGAMLSHLASRARAVLRV